MPAALGTSTRAGGGVEPSHREGEAGHDSGRQHRSRPSRTQTKPLVVAVIAFTMASLFAMRVLSADDWDPSIFVGFGVEATRTTEYAEDRLGPVFLRENHGHDGKTFFVLANDPLLLNPEENAAILEHPAYRSQRMMYPLMSSAGGLFSPGAIVWAMLVVNLVALGVGTWAAGAVAADLGASSWWGLGFALNLGFVSALVLGTADIVAGAFLFLAVRMLIAGRPRSTITFLALAALTRPSTLVVAVGLTIWLWQRGDRARAKWALGAPVTAVVSWAFYVQWRLGWTSDVEVGSFGPPLRGFVDAFPNWLNNPEHMAAGLAMLTLVALFARRALRDRALISWAFSGYVVIGLLLVKQVWAAYWDVTRVMAPMTTAFVLLVAAKGAQWPTPDPNRALTPLQRR
ncbi:MAG: hypothetical protein WCE80_03195 [Acidimicrobiia bacterium]